MVSFTDVPPLQSDTPIVEPGSGRPSSQFIRLWQNTFQNAKGNKDDAAVALEKATAAETAVNELKEVDIIAGTALHGGGSLGDAPADITIHHDDSPVTPGTYGSATKSAVITVDAQGHVTEVTEEDIAGGGGGGGGSYTLIEDFVSVGGETDYTFATIPSGFEDIILVASVKTNHTDIQQLRVQLNGDTGNNYNYYTIDSYRSGSDYKESNTSTDCLRLGYIAQAATGGNGTANSFGTAEATFYDYTASKLKRMGGLYKGGRLTYDAVNGQSTGEWLNTAAITALKVFIDTSTFQAGTRLTLYGRGGSGGGGGAAVSARYWRHRLVAHDVTHSNANDGFGMCLIDWRNGAGTLLSGYTASASSTDTGGGWSIAEAFNGSSASFNGWYTGANTYHSHPWMAIDFGVAVTPTELRFAPLTGFTWTIGTQTAVEYSTDGVIWHQLCLLQNRAGADNVAEAYTIQ